MTTPANETSVTWIAQHLRRRGWRVAKDDSERADADFLVSYDDCDGCRQDEPQDLIWLSVVARHELRVHRVDDDDVTRCWRAVRPRVEVAAEYTAFIEALWQTPEGKRLRVALMWSHCALATQVNCEAVDLHFSRRDGKPLPPTPTLDAFGEILLNLSLITEQRAADHLARIDEMFSSTGKLGSMFAEARRLKAKQGLTGDVLITRDEDGQMELLPIDDC